jgi:hypothetical protein
MGIVSRFRVVYGSGFIHSGILRIVPINDGVLTGLISYLKVEMPVSAED